MNQSFGRFVKSGWHFAETNLRCEGISRICMIIPNIVGLIVVEITQASQQTFLD